MWRTADEGGYDLPIEHADVPVSVRHNLPAVAKRRRSRSRRNPTGTATAKPSASFVVEMPAASDTDGLQHSCLFAFIRGWKRKAPGGFSPAFVPQSRNFGVARPPGARFSYSLAS